MERGVLKRLFILCLLEKVERNQLDKAIFIWNRRTLHKSFAYLLRDIVTPLGPTVPELQREINLLKSKELIDANNKVTEKGEALLQKAIRVHEGFKKMDQKLNLYFGMIDIESAWIQIYEENGFQLYRRQPKKKELELQETVSKTPKKPNIPVWIWSGIFVVFICFLWTIQ